MRLVRPKGAYAFTLTLRPRLGSTQTSGRTADAQSWRIIGIAVESFESACNLGASFKALTGLTVSSRRGAGGCCKDMALRHSFRQSFFDRARFAWRTRPGARSRARASKPLTAAAASTLDVHAQRPNSFTSSSCVISFRTSHGTRCILKRAGATDDSINCFK